MIKRLFHSFIKKHYIKIFIAILCMVVVAGTTARVGVTSSTPLRLQHRNRGNAGSGACSAGTVYHAASKGCLPSLPAYPLDTPPSCLDKRNDFSGPFRRFGNPSFDAAVALRFPFPRF